MTDNDLLISVAEDHMKNKQYDPQLYLVSFNNGEIIKEKNESYKCIRKEDLKKAIKQILHKSYYKCNKLIEAYISFGLIKEEEDYYIFNVVEKPFIGLSADSVRFCLDYVPEFSFKIYCYLMYKYQLHLYVKKKYGQKENYFFSKTEIALALGYSKKQDTLLEINRALVQLDKMGLIKYSTSRKRPGHNGMYHELYWVHQYSSVHLEADSAFVQSLVDKNETITEETFEKIAEPIKDQYFLKGNAGMYELN